MGNNSLKNFCRWTVLASLTLPPAALAQAGVPTQPAFGQSSAGTAAATGGRQNPSPGTTTQSPNTQAPPSQVTVPSADMPANAPASVPETSTQPNESPAIEPAPREVPSGKPLTSPDAFDEGGTPVSSKVAPRPGPLPEKNVEDPSDTSDLIPVPPMPLTSATLIGGFVKDVDPVNDRVTVAPFGSKQKLKIFFDERSKVYRNGREVSPIAIHKGDRIYLDTQLDKQRSRIFARNVRVQTKPLQTDAHGQIVNFDSTKSVVVVHDDLGGQDVSFHLQPNTTVDNQGHPGALPDLQRGALITARFIPTAEGRNEVNQIVILAAPGSAYTFEGKLTYLNVGRHVMGLENQSDGKIYDISYDPAQIPIGNLTIGSTVNVSAKFDGNRYDAESLNEASSLSLEDQEQAAKDDQNSQKQDKKDKKEKKSKKHDNNTDNNNEDRQE